MTSSGGFATEVAAELERARERHRPIHSPHEGYAVILEELDEFWEQVRSPEPGAELDELVQIAAMAQRTAEDLNLIARPFYSGGPWHELTVELRGLLSQALARQRDPCDHTDIGKPGCLSCDPSVRAAVGTASVAAKG